MVISMNTEPQTYEEACKHPKWITTMQREIEALQANNT